MSEKNNNNQSFDINKIKLEGVKLKYRHCLIETYEKLSNLDIIKPDNWNSIFEKLITNNSKNITFYVNEFLIFYRDTSEEDVKKAYTYILGLVHQDILNDFLSFIKNEKTKKFKRFLKKIKRESDIKLQNTIDNLLKNNVDITEINKMLEIDVLSDLINSITNISNTNTNEDPITYYFFQNCIEDDEEYDEDDEEYDEEYDDEEYDEEYEYNCKADKEYKNDKTKKNEKKFLDLIKSRENKPKTLLEEFRKLNDDEQKNIVKELTEINSSLDIVNNLQVRVLKSNLSIYEKKELLSRIEVQGNDKKGKFKEYCEFILSFPFKKFKKMNTENLDTPEQIKNLLNNAKETLDKSIYGHDEAKHNILSHISQMITNPNSSGKALGLVGTKGVGKTSLVENGFCKILGLPFVMISLAGLTDGSYFTGHHYTYEGSQPGKIVEGIKSAGVLNPVFFCDELDKISDTDKGREISNKLIQLIDPVQNNHFQDTYFGNINIDLSKAIWIFTWNNSKVIDPILLDRIKVIKVKGFSLEQKLIISRDYLIPSIIKEVGIRNGINITDEVIKYIINSLTYEGGVRKLKELLFEIVSEFNMKTLTSEIEFKSPPRKKRRLEKKEMYDITMENIDKFLIKKIPYSHIKIRDQDLVGNIIGLYATNHDVGGIIPISIKMIPSDTILSLSLTGNLGKIMKESAQVAKTVAWDRTPDGVKNILNEKWKNRKEGIHIHCTEAFIEKEGSSAGTAIAVCLYSVLNNLLIRKDIGITGEIDLNGKVLPIGGLMEKMYGAKIAGCKTVLFPEENIKDYNRVIEDCPNLIDDSFKAFPIKTFEEALTYLII